ncbi:ATP-binding cassette domain-containing protein [Vibrio comitans]|uniref:Toxin ABC transporter n=1 Tax=Vibrio comitans NBRC 102076 TaxID=1219078 RepID=A0A4Y3IQX1_9VIBR|nr:ATP-binding cassette domain-containing protein [Vibrio comitans]GEA61941.1 toxin ABC transporter [Vibrio comitans NBRC 102076]
MKNPHLSQRISLPDKFYLALSTIMTTLLGLVLPFSILIIFDRVLPNQAKDTLFLLFTIILLAIVLDYQLKKQEEHIINSIMKRFETNLTTKVFNSICLAKVSKFQKLEPGEYLERIATIDEMKSFFGGETVKSLINLCISLVTILIIGFINLGAGATLLVASFILAVSANHIANRKISELEIKSDVEGVTQSKIIEIVSMPLDNKSRTMEHRLESIMTAMIEEREDKSIDYEKLESEFNLILSLIQQLSITTVVVLLATAVINLEASQGIMAAVIMLTNRYFAPYQQVMRTLSRWKLNSSQVERIAEVMSLHSNPGNNTDPIRIENISVKTSLHKRIEFNRGNIYLMKGKSASGKTHLTSCMTQDRLDETLTVKCNGQPLTDYDYMSWRENVSHINRHSRFIEGTIIENITCFRSSKNNEAFSVCESLGIKSEVDSLSSGFYTLFSGNKQVPFSRQTYYALLVVRAIVSNKELIVLDDVDNVFSEAFIANLVTTLVTKSSNNIIIIISNNLSKKQSRNLKQINMSKEIIE